MEFICEKKNLQTAVSAVERIVTTRSTLPIIGYILFQANKSGLKISANNLEMAVELEIKAKVSKTGSILIPAKTLSGIVAKLPNGDVGFELTEKGTMRVSYGQSNFNVHTLPADEFPALPKAKEGKTITVPGLVFASMIKKTIFAVSTSEDKYVLTGILLEIGKSPVTGDSSNIRLISTDGYRLAKRGEKITLKTDVKGEVIIPAKALQEVLRVIEGTKGEEDLIISFSNDQISFKYSETYLVSRLIQGQFPDYRQVMPKKSNTKLTVATKDLLASAERAAVIAAGSANVVRFETKGGKLHLFANTPDVGTVDEVLAVELQGEAKRSVAFNIRLFTDVLKVVDTDKVIIELTESLGPGILKEEAGGDYIYIIMPIRTQEAS
ncbi:MAG: DNA polymerase III subunit beta [bacterium]